MNFIDGQFYLQPDDNLICSQMTKPSQSFHVSVGEALTLRLMFYCKEFKFDCFNQQLAFNRCGMLGITGADIHWYKVDFQSKIMSDHNTISKIMSDQNTIFF